MCLCSCIYSLWDFHHIKICALIPNTAGFGVFAGRAFKQYELLPATWKTLYLPENFPKSQILRNYVFGHNETHMALVLDYGSLFNHHESANVEVLGFSVLSHVPFQVRMGFVYAN